MATAMAVKVSRPVQRRPAEVVVRIIMLLVGFFAVIWGGWSLPVFKAQASPQSVAAKIFQGDSYKIPSLLLTLRQTEGFAASYSFCNPAALRSLVAIRLGIFNDKIGENDPTPLEPLYDALYTSARQSLNCSPADLFVWLTLFWINAARHGLNANNENYLRMSYLTGPNEAWIALWRSRLLFGLFNGLPPDLADDAVSDFVNLVDTYLVTLEMVALFEKTSQNGRDHIARRLKEGNGIARDAFLQQLHVRGLDNEISRQSPDEPRPWR